MALIVVKIVPPAVLAGQSNGQLNPAILADTPGLAGGPRIRLLADTATRAWRAMCAAAPMVLQATSRADSYRTYDQQVDTFTSRYQVEPTTNGYRLWDSDGNGVPERWYKKDDVASAAVPGRSNHGWGLAVDVANASGARLDWLEAHALAYGWSWELVPEEPWHIHYWAGDAIPQAVLDYEEAQMGLEEWTATPNTAKPWALTQGNPGFAGQERDTGLAFAWEHAYKARQAAEAAAVLGKANEAKLDQILALLQAGGPAGPVDVTDAAVAKIADAVLDEQHDRLAE